jgi:hypothetical protein
MGHPVAPKIRRLQRRHSGYPGDLPEPRWTSRRFFNRNHRFFPIHRAIDLYVYGF